MSPAAPKTTRMQGSPLGAVMVSFAVSRSAVTSLAVTSSAVTSAHPGSGSAASGALRGWSLFLHRVAAELVAQRRDHLHRGRVVLARGEARVERRSKDR